MDFNFSFPHFKKGTDCRPEATCILKEDPEKFREKTLLEMFFARRTGYTVKFQIRRSSLGSLYRI